MATIRVFSTGIPAPSATAISLPTARMSCPSFVFSNMTKRRQKAKITTKVATGIESPCISIVTRESSAFLMPGRAIVFLTPYPLESKSSGSLSGKIDPIQ